MLAFIVRRLLLTLPVAWIVVTLVFGLIHMVPGDPVAQMLGEGTSATEVERVRHELGLDRPVLDQYRTYMIGMLHGDLGISIGNQHSNGARIDARGNPAGLCADSARKRTYRAHRFVRSRPEEWIDSGDHCAWPSGRNVVDWRHHYGNDLFLARLGTAYDSGDQR